MGNLDWFHYNIVTLFVKVCFSVIIVTMKKVMVFGVFDGFHDGHRELFKQAKVFGDYLIVVVAQDKIVEQLKGRRPRMNLAQRCELLRAEPAVSEFVAGDSEHGVWEVVKKLKPDIIALGYDQHAMKAGLESHLDEMSPQPHIVVLKSHKPNELHNTLINKRALDNDSKMS